MSDQSATDLPSGAEQSWDTVRRIREPLAWFLLALAALAVLVSAWQLAGLPGAPGPVPVASTAPVSAPGPVSAQGAGATPAPAANTGGRSPALPAAGTFGVRASALAGQFVSGGVVTLTMVSVILVTFAGGMTSRARQVAQTTAAIQAAAIVLGLVSWLAAAGAGLRPGPWFIFIAIDLAAVVTALVFTVAVLRSPALRTLSPVPDFGEDDEDLDEDDEEDEKGT